MSPTPPVRQKIVYVGDDKQPLTLYKNAEGEVSVDEDQLDLFAEFLAKRNEEKIIKSVPTYPNDIPLIPNPERYNREHQLLEINPAIELVGERGGSTHIGGVWQIGQTRLIQQEPRIRLTRLSKKGLPMSVNMDGNQFWMSVEKFESYMKDGYVIPLKDDYMFIEGMKKDRIRSKLVERGYKPTDLKDKNSDEMRFQLRYAVKNSDSTLVIPSMGDMIETIEADGVSIEKYYKDIPSYLWNTIQQMEIRDNIKASPEQTIVHPILGELKVVKYGKRYNIITEDGVILKDTSLKAQVGKELADIFNNPDQYIEKETTRKGFIERDLKRRGDLKEGLYYLKPTRLRIDYDDREYRLDQFNIPIKIESKPMISNNKAEDLRGDWMEMVSVSPTSIEQINLNLEESLQGKTISPKYAKKFFKDAKQHLEDEDRSYDEEEVEQLKNILGLQKADKPTRNAVNVESKPSKIIKTDSIIMGKIEIERDDSFTKLSHKKAGSNLSFVALIDKSSTVPRHMRDEVLKQFREENPKLKDRDIIFDIDKNSTIIRVMDEGITQNKYRDKRLSHILK